MNRFLAFIGLKGRLPASILRPAEREGRMQIEVEVVVAELTVALAPVIHVAEQRRGREHHSGDDEFAGHEAQNPADEQGADDNIFV